MLFGPVLSTWIHEDLSSELHICNPPNSVSYRRSSKQTYKQIVQSISDALKYCMEIQGLFEWLCFYMVFRASGLLGKIFQECLFTFCHPVAKAAPTRMENQVMQYPGKERASTRPHPIHLHEARWNISIDLHIHKIIT